MEIEKQMEEITRHMGDAQNEEKREELTDAWVNKKREPQPRIRKMEIRRRQVT